ncbi:MAG: class I SAM-dependent methyltransferase [Pseudomonadota bacterium]|nr:class I SAM-dependent methyltransferase [Pseudomonadota bacterium]
MAEYVSSSRVTEKCQICGHKELDSVLFLGFVPPVNTMPELGTIASEQPAFPLELVRCTECGHVQIGLEVDADVLFPYSYPYLSGSTRILRHNFADLYTQCRETLKLENNKDLVIDIGSNDGTLLENFYKGGLRVLGVEPSQAGEVARERGVETLTAYFGREIAESVREKYGAAKLITAANVFAHIADPHAVIEGILALLDDGGVFVNESHYLLPLVETLQYDTVYHEHLRYYHLGALQTLFAGHGLEIFKVKRIPTHGGSIRVFAARRGTFPIDSSVLEAIAEEDAKGITDGSALKTFRDRVIKSKAQLIAMLAPIKEDGARIYGIGAPSRASTLINYTGLDDGLIDCVMEVSSSHKLNKYMPGTRIPVLDEKKLYEDQPEYALLLSWHISDDLIAIIRKNGFKGKFIVPLPTPVIID